MKERELRDHATCRLCRKPMLHSGVPLFWRFTVERFGIDGQAVRRQSGLETMLGSVALAQAMGPAEDMAKPVMEKVVIAVCEPCALDRIDALAMIALEPASGVGIEVRL